VSWVGNPRGPPASVGAQFGNIYSRDSTAGWGRPRPASPWRGGCTNGRRCLIVTDYIKTARTQRYMCGPENVDYRIPRRGNPILLGYLPDYLEEPIKAIQLGQERPSRCPLLSPRRSLQAKRPDKKGIVGMRGLAETMHLEVVGVGVKRITPAC
jgi:hypothetical protein